jgi:DNA-binding NarL/FixJ family response regulator
MSHVEVLLIEDHPVVLHGLQTICSSQADIRVVGWASTANDALEAAALLQPDVAILPVRLGGTRSGIELCRSIKSLSRARVVVFTSFSRTIDVQVAMLAGADALLNKTVGTVELLDVIRQVARGEEPLLGGSSRTRPAPFAHAIPSEGLTERENEILQLVMEGCTNPEIASRLTIEVSTVKTHMRHILRKLGVGTRRDLLADG